MAQVHLFQKDNIEQSIWDTCAAIGNMLGEQNEKLGEQLENLNEEQSEKLMRTTWEPQKSKKSNYPHPSQKGK